MRPCLMSLLAIALGALASCGGSVSPIAGDTGNVPDAGTDATAVARSDANETSRHPVVTGDGGTAVDASTPTFCGHEFDAGTAPAATTCATVLDDFSAIIGRNFRIGGCCEQDADCTLIAPKLDCQNSSLTIGTCVMALSAARAASIAQHIDDLAARACPLQCGIGSEPSCMPAVAKCVSGACRTMQP